MNQTTCETMLTMLGFYRAGPKPVNTWRKDNNTAGKTTFVYFVKKTGSGFIFSPMDDHRLDYSNYDELLIALKQII